MCVIHHIVPWATFLHCGIVCVCFFVAVFVCVHLVDRMDERLTSRMACPQIYSLAHTVEGKCKLTAL